MVRRGLGLLLLVLLICEVTWVHGQAEGLVIIGTQDPPVKETAYTRDEVLQFMRNTDAPAFSLPSVEGVTVNLADYRGDIVLISFWVSWDPACLENMALLNSAQKQYPDDVIALIINNLPAESKQASWSEQTRLDHIDWVRGYLAENDYRISVLIDADGEVSGMHDYLGTHVPMTCFIDRDGVLRIPWQGQLTEQTLDTLLAMMFALDP